MSHQRAGLPITATLGVHSELKIRGLFVSFYKSKTGGEEKRGGGKEKKFPS